MTRPLKKAIFLDRDGVINVKLPENRYVTNKSEFTLISGVTEALGILKSLGFLLIVITNQRGIARGFMTEEDLRQVHKQMIAELETDGISLDGIYYCPHDELEGCSCRKPEPGMVLTACKDLDIELSNSFLIGDSPSDIAAGRKAGVNTVRIAVEPDDNADYTFNNLIDFALFLHDESEHRQNG